MTVKADDRTSQGIDASNRNLFSQNRFFLTVRRVSFPEMMKMMKIQPYFQKSYTRMNFVYFLVIFMCYRKVSKKGHQTHHLHHRPMMKMMK